MRCWQHCNHDAGPHSTKATALHYEDEVVTSITVSENRKSPFRERLKNVIEQPAVQHSIIALILINALILGLETSPAIMAETGPLLVKIDAVILGLFVLEIAARLFVHRLSFWRDPWSVFDFVVVAVALVPAAGPFAVIRALRVLRVLRLLTMVPSMRRVVGALLSAIPGLSSIALVLLIIFYVFAVIATNLFAQTFPEWFGSIGHSFYTLFQVMTLESWSMGISRPVMEQFPYAWAFFIPFILVATFTMLNLFIAIIVSAMQTYTETEEKEHPERSTAHLHHDMDQQMEKLHAEIAELKQLLTQAVQNSNIKS